jgi:hypothetical protein
VVDGYKIPTTLPNDEDVKRYYHINAKVLNFIQGGLA